MSSACDVTLASGLKWPVVDRGSVCVGFAVEKERGGNFIVCVVFVLEIHREIRLMGTY